MRFKEELIQSQLKHSGRVVSFYEDRVRLSNGKTVLRDVVKHPGAVAILVLNEHQEMLLVRQYRHAVGRELWEIPAGKIDPGESAEKTAYRELSEETPYTATHMERLYEMIPTAGFCDEVIYIYKATGIQENSVLTPDEDEFIEYDWIALSELKSWISCGKIQDAKTLIAILTCLKDL